MEFKRKLIAHALAGAMLSVAGNAAASGFALLELGASGMGAAYAGGAASAEDATTVYFNPAGMSRLSGKQVTVGAHAIVPSAKYSGSVAGLAPLQTGGTGAGGDAGSLALVPNVYFAMEAGQNAHFGLGINTPFGLQSQYDANWMGRYQGIKSSLKAVNLNPSASYRLNDQISVGAGLNYQRISGELSSMTNYSAAAYQAGFAAGGLAGAAAALTAAGGPGKEGVNTLTGSDSAWGYNFGVLFTPDAATRVGMAYRSRIRYNLNGTVTFANRPAALAAALPDQSATLAVAMPDSFSLSAVHRLDERLQIMADATWTGWSVFQQLNVLKANGSSLGTPTPENWKNTWRVSVGGDYRYDERWLARAGIAFEQTPVSDTYRTVRIPDADRFQIALGGQYKLDRDSAIDFGYTHLFFRNASLNQNATVNTDLAGKGYLTGAFRVSADILGVQYAYGF